mmetsp:Transcript_6943/g.12783  ORF Transcript_6943/g.12783 Transcript_6943/m.12783 type:complete len:220 (-) Transcript_6943:202-861(-)|eukprot:CAMPEP_0197516980 /NCGR_PEP_ID=MMETSP1318-20131121/1950_1 /TAXON_ID=552666 /ORGANISM="Partenskyella glossopodia, Strain RCC365" /LENGTH=219 /DNA_ID=CAMNT_0043066181 /DNA_START=98 /DNA_END=757 /DNA_ORIENTATION=-
MSAWEANLKKYWIDYAGKISGRDKIYRFVQYFSRMLYFQLEQSGAPKETVAWFKLISKTMSTGRKMQRLGKFVDNWYKAFKHLQKKVIGLSSEQEIINTLGLMAYISDMIFYVWDALAWSKAAKIMKFPGMDVKRSRNQWNMIRYGLKSVRYSLMWRAAYRDGKSFGSYRRQAVKSALDFMNPCKSLGYNSLNDGQLGLLGVVTSSISIYDDFAKKSEK